MYSSVFSTRIPDSPTMFEITQTYAAETQLSSSFSRFAEYAIASVSCSCDKVVRCQDDNVEQQSDWVTRKQNSPDLPFADQRVGPGDETTELELADGVAISHDPQLRFWGVAFWGTTIDDNEEHTILSHLCCCRV